MEPVLFDMTMRQAKASDVVRKYAIIYLSLQKKDTKIPINDVWIAASCMEVGGTLLTGDKHFEVVEQIETVILG